jgi:class 3 adenylate cyclase
VSAQPTIDELLDQAVRALNRGDRPTADALAGRVLQVDRGNADAEELLAAPADSGEIRRMTIIFADLVDSTALSTRLEPEVYRTVVGRYRDEVLRIVNRYEGHVGSTKGDGVLAVFGHPKAHESGGSEGARAMIDTITRSFEKNPPKARIKSREVLSGGPVAREQRRAGLRRLAQLVADLLPPSRALNRSDVLLLGLGIVAAADELLMTWMDGAEGLTRDRVVDVVTLLFDATAHHISST